MDRDLGIKVVSSSTNACRRPAPPSAVSPRSKAATAAAML